MRRSAADEGLYKKDGFCYDKENRQLQTEMLTEHSGQMVDKWQGRMWKSSRIYKDGGEKDVQSEQGIEQ